MKRIIPVIILVTAIGSGYWWFNQPATAILELASQPTALVGSGTIEAETVVITAELGGRVIELKVGEGDEVKIGQVLVELDKSDLLAQQIQLAAALTKAKSNLDLIGAPARSEDIAVARTQLKQAEVAADGAKRTWQSANALLNNPHELEAQVNQARTRVTKAERELEMAQVNLKRMDMQA
jgi:multidrug efflux pump subunit AcrA (membrane-fusion protein)